MEAGYTTIFVVCPFVLFSFGHCVVFPSPIYGFWLPLWYLQTLLIQIYRIISKVLRSPPSFGWPWWNICVTNDHGYVPLVVSTFRSFPQSWLIIGFVTRLTRRVSLVEQELPTLLEHPSSSTVFSGVRVTRSLVLCVCFVCRCLFFCTFSSGHCVICPSIYGFWLPLSCLQFLLIVLIRLGLGVIKPFKYELCTRISKYIQSGSPTH